MASNAGICRLLRPTTRCPSARVCHLSLNATVPMFGALVVGLAEDKPAPTRILGLVVVLRPCWPGCAPHNWPVVHCQRSGHSSWAVDDIPALPFCLLCAAAMTLAGNPSSVTVTQVVRRWPHWVGLRCVVVVCASACRLVSLRYCRRAAHRCMYGVLPVDYRWATRCRSAIWKTVLRCSTVAVSLACHTSDADMPWSGRWHRLSRTCLLSSGMPARGGEQLATGSAPATTLMPDATISMLRTTTRWTSRQRFPKSPDVCDDSWRSRGRYL
jgi:hypothetical protein